MALRSAALRLTAALAFAAALAAGTAHRAGRAADVLPEPFDVASIDRSANACTNFFDFATGNWREAHPIPADEAEYGYIERLTDDTSDRVRRILETAVADPGPAGGERAKLGAFYGSCMDEAGIERAGTAALAPLFARIDGLHDRDRLAAVLADLQAAGVNAGFGAGPAQNADDSTQVIANVTQGGLGLGDRDYYLRTDPKSLALRTQYRDHVAAMLRLAGDAAPAQDAAAVLALETDLARGALSAAARRDPANTLHHLDAAGVAALLPHVGFAAYAKAAHVPTGGTINVAAPSFLQAFDAQAASAPLSAWRAYLRWRVLDRFASAMPKRFADEDFAFHGRILRGVAQQEPRWKRCVAATDGALGMALGRAYVADAFPPPAKAAALAMTERIRAAYKEEIGSLDWMSPATKATAIAKLEAMGLKVGYPDLWRSYAGYDVRRGDFLGDVVRSDAFERATALAKIGKPLDRNEWSMTPQTVNAYNAPSRNEIVLPAAQLQRPFFDAGFDDAANLAATGAGTVGHEMTHGFDDQGHKYDLHGNLRNWWAPQDAANFDGRAACVIKQFDDAVAVGDVHYQGKLVAGEAIADLGGVVIGYRALEDALAHGQRTTIDGFTPEQRYFIAFAQSWTESVRDEEARTEALSDPHPLPRDRVNLTLRNVPGWYSAFNCPRPPSICEVW